MSEQLYRMGPEPRPAAFFGDAVHTLDDFLSPAECRSLLTEVRASAQTPQALIAPGQDQLYDPKVRRTQQAFVSRSSQALVTKKLMALRHQLGAKFGLNLTACQTPQFLVYRPGDFFQAHSDVIHGSEKLARRRSLSAVIFLNAPNDAEMPYSGGELLFYCHRQADQLLGYPLALQAGQMVTFRPDLIHEVLPVSAGLRCSIVSWYY